MPLLVSLKPLADDDVLSELARLYADEYQALGLKSSQLCYLYVSGADTTQNYSAELISKYASDPFEIEIAWGERDGRQYPVIVVPSGVKVPVAAKRDLIDGARTAIRVGAVYFRSLASNGTPSTTEARPSDWADIVEICFDNREADVGRFIRRHLAGLDLSTLIKLVGQPSAPTPTLCDRALKLIDDGEARFQEAIKARKLSVDEEKLLKHGFFSVGLVIDPARTGSIPDQEFMNRIASSNPKYTGWPFWLDARTIANPENRPKVIENAFEYLVVSLSPGFTNHIDFARLDPKGEFFLHRLLQDDGAPSRARPGQVLDPTLMCLRAAEAMGVGIAFAKALGWPPDKTTLGFGFRWHKLKGRQLTAWDQRRRRGSRRHDRKLRAILIGHPALGAGPICRRGDQTTVRRF